MFGVVVCPKCDQSRGIRLSAKRSKCPRCGATYDVSLLKIYFITENESELGEAVRSAAIQLQQREFHLPDFDIDRDVSATVGRATKGMKKGRLSKEEIDTISMEVIKKHGAFTLEAFEKVLMERHPEEAGRIMERLRAEDGVASEQDRGFDLDLTEDLGPEYRRTSREERVFFVLKSLSESQGAFTKEDVRQALGISTKGEMDELMSKLLEKGIIAETRIGLFKLV